jgi:hypothetical protein
MGNPHTVTVEEDSSRMMFTGSRGQPGISTSDDPPGSINGVIPYFLILITVICLCLCLGSRITRSSQVLPAEDTLEGAVKKKEDLESRKKKILQSFEANNTSMVRKKALVEKDESSARQE